MTTPTTRLRKAAQAAIDFIDDGDSPSVGDIVQNSLVPRAYVHLAGLLDRVRDALDEAEAVCELSPDKIAAIALRAFDESELMNEDHIREGILPREAGRNFSMQAAIQVVDQLRKTGTCEIWVGKDDPRWKP